MFVIPVAEHVMGKGSGASLELALVCMGRSLSKRSWMLDGTSHPVSLHRG